MISAQSLSFSYRDVTVVDNVSLHTEAGKLLGLVGPNGSGKTTLLRMLHGALKPRSGTVEVGGQPLARLTTRQIAQAIAVVAQEDVESEFETLLTAGEMVVLGRSPHHGIFRSTSSRDRELAAQALERVGLADHGSKPYSQLSGGERKRVLIARALVQESPYLLLDEPTNHLDVRYQHEILALIRSLNMTGIIVLHDLNLAAHYCDRLLLLDQGRAIETGAPDEVLTPERINRVYAVTSERVSSAGVDHFLFQPHSSVTASATSRAL